jgi:hypothetical protein
MASLEPTVPAHALKSSVAIRAILYIFDSLLGFDVVFHVFHAVIVALGLAPVLEETEEDAQGHENGPCALHDLAFQGC